MRHLIVCAVLAGSVVGPGVGRARAQAAERCAAPVGRVVSDGPVSLRSAVPTVQNVAVEGVTGTVDLCVGDVVETGPNTRAFVLFETGEHHRIGPNAEFRLLDPTPDGRSVIDVIRGLFYFFSRLPTRIDVTTPSVTAGVEGTEFAMLVEPDRTVVTVLEGLVQLTNPQGMLLLGANQTAEALLGQAPQLVIVAEPRDAVQWAINYSPASFAFLDAPGAPPLPPGVAASLVAFQSGDVVQALTVLDQVPDGARDSRFYTYRAGLFLGVGNVDGARNDLDQALMVDPANGDAYGLLAIIAVADNDPEQALENGQRAVALSPTSSSARVALSYAQQANFDLEAARDSLVQAVADQPADALAWARLAEMWLSFGDLDRALEAANEAAARAPNLARTQTVLGFARLSQIRLGEARDAFERAIELDSEHSLAWLGLGLAKIRGGDLEGGRGDLETAVVMDPNNSLLRSYLGKAFFEEKRDDLAREELDVAKGLDPNDPTPYFYDAIRKQTVNRPIEAMRDLEHSIELNDNRAIYRSALRVDEDNGARSTSLGRLYRDLSFEQLALREGWKSANADLANFSAHRLLSDSYSTLRNHQIARVSELLVSQLLQPVNLTPLQPQLAETDLFILEGAGPSDVGFDEFTPLFTRNQTVLQANGIAGGLDTVGDDMVLSGLQGRVSYSLGQFHYKTDGFRSNNDQTRNIYNVFVQGQLSSRTSVQTEFRHADSESGDLTRNFDSSNFSAVARELDRSNSVRAGLHHEFSPGSNLIVSAMYSKGREISIGLPGVFEFDTRENGYIVEAQQLLRTGRTQWAVGAGYFSSDSTNDILAGVPLPTEEASVTHANVYAYSYIDYPRDFTFVIGASADFYEDPDFTRNHLNPKFGVTWRLAPATELRAASSRSLTRSLVASTTIEPTQVSGFNQFFDDAPATDSWRSGIGLDQSFSPDLHAGIEVSRRDLDVPFFLVTAPPPPGPGPGPPPPPAPPVPSEASWREDGLGAYVYWTPHPWIAATVEVWAEDLTRPPELSPEFFTVLETRRVPLRLNFDHPSGLRVRAGVTYVDQAGDFETPAFSMNFVRDDEQFWIADLSVGYRLPQRAGVVSLAFRNLTDRTFRFQDTYAGNPLFWPARQVFVRLTLAL